MNSRQQKWWNNLRYFLLKNAKFTIIFLKRLLFRLDSINRIFLFFLSFFLVILLVLFWGGLLDKSFDFLFSKSVSGILLFSFSFYLLNLLIQNKVKPLNFLFHGVVMLILVFLFFKLNTLTVGEQFEKILFSLVALVIFVSLAGEYFQYIYTVFQRVELLFVLSFLLLIFLGALLLYFLPEARCRDLTFIDAVFISTSAVCVTGLTPVDITSHFTPFGQTIILILIQLGGIGILTFLTFIASSARSTVSLYQSRATGASLGLSKQQGRVFLNAFMVVVLVTLIIEAMGAFLLYVTIPDTFISSRTEKIYLSVFHSVSAFCNAGFSNITGGLENPAFRQAYLFQFVIAVLIILGGLGFFTLYGMVLKLRDLLNFKRKNLLPYHYAHLYLSSRIILRMTFILILMGILLFWVFENFNSLSGLTWLEKLKVSFFMSVTPRTAGFSIIDVTTLKLPAILLIIFLMWIGASPVSTGGGIKTTTIALAFKTLWSYVVNRNDVTFFHRKVSIESIRRAFVAVFFSVFIIFVATLLMSLVEKKHGLVQILFETVSAFGTVGLSLGLTPVLSDFSKIVLMSLMFIGRLGFVTVFVAFFKYRHEVFYDLPEEDVLI